MSQKTKNGFSLIEAMVATLIMSIAFAGVYSLTIYASTNLKNSVDRQKMQMIANQILENIYSDVANINNYDNMDLTTCVAPGSTPTTAETNAYNWCQKISDAVGTIVNTEIRHIEVAPAYRRDVNGVVIVPNEQIGNSVEIILESRNSQAQIIIKSLYGL